jgi:hypothetical protein
MGSGPTSRISERTCDVQFGPGRARDRPQSLRPEPPGVWLVARRPSEGEIGTAVVRLECRKRRPWAERRRERRVCVSLSAKRPRSGRSRACRARRDRGNAQWAVQPTPGNRKRAAAATEPIAAVRALEAWATDPGLAKAHDASGDQGLRLVRRAPRRARVRRAAREQYGSHCRECGHEQEDSAP